MRICSLAALAIIAASGYQSQPDREVTAIVDSEAAVAHVEESAPLRARVLTRVERHAPVFYFDLTAAGIRSVPDSAHESFLLATSPSEPPKRPGISLTFNEATEILRKNEAVRDAVIVRECSASPVHGCGSAVHVAATTLVSDVESATRQKLQHFLSIASSRPAAMTILITAGWPYRDEKRLDLGATVAALRQAGTRLVVLRLPALVAYQGLVKDATETLASRFSATFIALNDERDVARVDGLLSKQIRPPVNATPGPATVTSASPEPPSRGNTSALSDLPDDLLRRAAEYVGQFERTFSAVIWRERYQQEVRVQRRFSSSGTSFSSLAARRVLDSELLFVWLPRDASWIAVRDVLAVDGKPRPAADRPLSGLLRADAVSVDQLKRLATANAQFNIGNIVRTFSEPTLALLFLDRQYRQRFAFTRRGDETINGERVTTYEFVEHGKPTVIRDQDRDLPVRGMFWIDSTTGRVRQTTLELADPDRQLNGRMTAQYGTNPKFDVLVPLEMRERYTSASGEEVTAVATYSDFRRFEATVRLK